MAEPRLVARTANMKAIPQELAQLQVDMNGGEVVRIINRNGKFAYTVLPGSTDGATNRVIPEPDGSGDVPGIDAGAGLADGGRLLDDSNRSNADPAETAVADSATSVAAQPASAAAAAVAFPYTQNPSGTVTVEGDPTAIRAALPDLKSTAVFKDGKPFGVLFATSSAPAVIAKLESNRVEDPTPRAEPAPESAPTAAPAAPAETSPTVAARGLPAVASAPVEAAGVIDRTAPLPDNSTYAASKIQAPQATAENASQRTTNADAVAASTGTSPTGAGVSPSFGSSTAGSDERSPTGNAVNANIS